MGWLWLYFCLKLYLWRPSQLGCEISWGAKLSGWRSEICCHWHWSILSRFIWVQGSDPFYIWWFYFCLKWYLLVRVAKSAWLWEFFRHQITISNYNIKLKIASGTLINKIPEKVWFTILGLECLIVLLGDLIHWYWFQSYCMIFCSMFGLFHLYRSPSLSINIHLFVMFSETLTYLPY